MKILAGDKAVFAVEIERRQYLGGWHLGGFRFWLRGKPVGDWDDSAALHACVNWLRQLVVEPSDRQAPDLYDASPEDVVRAIWDPYMRGPWSPEVSARFARHSLSHVGMSSFEFWDVFLLVGADGKQRCVWRSAREGTFHDCHLPPGEVERVAAETWDLFLASLETVFLTAGMPHKPRPPDWIRTLSIEQDKKPGAPCLLHSSSRSDPARFVAHFPTLDEAQQFAEATFHVKREAWRQATQRVGPLGGPVLTPRTRELERLLGRIRHARMAEAHHDQWEHGGSSSASSEQRAAMESELAAAVRTRTEATAALTALVAQTRASAPTEIEAWVAAHLAYLDAFLRECAVRGDHYDAYASIAKRERAEWADVRAGTRAFVDETYLDPSLVPGLYGDLFGLDPRTFEDILP
jgi:hypothetical protein